MNVDIKTCLNNLKNKSILVIGDLMIDEYIIGKVNRISPEAPVPVVDVKEEFVRFGGAANVCLNISSLGAKPIPVGVIGNDDAGKQFLQQAKMNQIDCDYLLTSNLRPTTVKTRIIGGSQQIVRYDRENSNDLTEQEQDMLIHNVEKALIKRVLILAKKSSIPVFVDPKFKHFFSYKNAYLFKPNKREVSEALQIDPKSDEDFKKAAVELKEKNKSKNILITLGSGGMLLYDEKNEFHFISSDASEVADVSGAGDTVIATLVCGYVGGLSIIDSTMLANKAAGVVVQELGIVPILPEQLL